MHWLFLAAQLTLIPVSVKRVNPALARVSAPLVGAGVGALSSSKKDRGKGALIGAAAGAALGGGVGYYMDVQEAKLRDKMKGTGVSVTRSGDNIILNMPNNMTFDSSSATLKPAGANTPYRRGDGAERVQQDRR
ncbi:OmpA/MotB domain-containing protein [Enterobacter asburiae]|uniref:OmpA/MotB domain-containing protein n=1 Tax=Enterobacter asburiae TaxID=61645 RepID=A0A376FFJ4_ENTAS|nr:OmpA/MotB domain-containing protein [Enterobacter asburiae]